MSELISGKEALNNWYDNIDTEIKFLGNMTWYDINSPEVTLEDFKDRGNKFRLKPCTITLNNIEIPATFEPKDGEKFWHLCPSMGRGYNFTTSIDCDHYEQFGAWRTEEEIKQVVFALRSVFKDGV